MFDSYPGGKGYLYQKLINLIPPHEVYIETHLGSGAVMRHKRLARLNIGIDLDETVIETWLTDNLAFPGDVNELAAAIVRTNDVDINMIDEGIRVFCMDAVDFLKSYPFTGHEFVYCDPPYLKDTRLYQKDYYRHEYTEDQHRELLMILNTLLCKVMVSGYASDLYAEILNGWTTKQFPAKTRGGTMAVEWVWFNYSEPVELHDYRYLGKNFRERERIKRKKQRWLTRLAAMPRLERQALLSVMQETNFTAASSGMEVSTPA